MIKSRMLPLLLCLCLLAAPARADRPANPLWWPEVQEIAKLALGSEEPASWKNAVIRMALFDHPKAVRYTLELAQRVQDKKEDIQSTDPQVVEYFDNILPGRFEKIGDPATVRYIISEVLTDTSSEYLQKLVLPAVINQSDALTERHLRGIVDSFKLAVHSDIVAWFEKHARCDSADELLDTLKLEKDAANQCALARTLGRLGHVEALELFCDLCAAGGKPADEAGAWIKLWTGVDFDLKENVLKRHEELAKLAKDTLKKLGGVKKLAASGPEQLWNSLAEIGGGNAGPLLHEMRRQVVKELRAQKEFAKLLDLIETYLDWQQDAAEQLAEDLWEAGLSNRVEDLWDTKLKAALSKELFKNYFDTLDMIEALLVEKNGYPAQNARQFPMDYAVLKNIPGTQQTVQTMGLTQNELDQHTQAADILDFNSKYDGLTDRERAHILLVNKYRLTRNLLPLRVDKRLVTSSREHSKYMRSTDTMEHIIKGHAYADTPAERMVKAGYPSGKEGGENICHGYETIEEAVDAFKKSPLHNKNMLAKDYIEIGIGEDSNWWTQNFGYDEEAD